MRIYIVQKDDTLYKIAKKHHVPVEEIIKLNPHIANPEYIVAGMKIKLPNQEDYKSDTGKAMRKTEREPKLNAKTNERPLGSVTEMDDKGAGRIQSRFPLGSVTEMDDRGAWEMHNRVPLKKREHFLGHHQNKSVEGQSEKQYKHNYEQPRTPNQQLKTYSNRQYVPLQENQRKQKQMHQSATMPYADRRPQMVHHHMHNQMMMPPAHPEQPYYCPCCMYHYQMQQSMMYRYNENERPKQQQRIYY